MKLYEVVTVGSALKDIMFYSNDVFVIENKKDVKRQRLLAVEYGTKIPIHNVHVNYGGGAMNVAVGLKNFGIFTAPMINLGRDLVGKEIYAHIKKLGIDTSLISVDKQEKTGFSIIIASGKDREHTIFTYKGASTNLRMPNLRGFRTEWFYVNALANKNWASEFEKIVRETRNRVKIAWNPGAQQLQDYKQLVKFLPRIEILMINNDEAIELVSNCSPRTPKTKLNNAKFLLNKLRELGPAKIIITRGAKGVIALDENGNYYDYPVETLKHIIRDTVGAGDAFGSGFLAAYIRWGNLGKALKVGLRNAAHVLYEVGAQNGLLKMKL